MSPTRALRCRLLRGAAALAGAAAFALAATACSTSTASSNGTGNGSNYVGGTGEISTIAQGHRTAAPDLSGKTVDGAQLSLADYRGKVVVVNVWGSWCPPCRAEAPHLAEVARQTKSQGVEFVGINTRDLQTAQAKAFEKEFGIPFPSLYDPAGDLLLRFPKGSLNPQAIPSTLILDRQGKIAVRALKELSAGELHKALDPVVAEK
ncbi:TlpA disulfide reductase family protein [Streptomyces sp. MI02-7b]|uniref:TlpA family protein disulfide reductase n=1 Tax=Streptomyces sp. MI02-7b TaxID=462941 RepID=UPI0029A2EE0D|nr:TlpA disulfide reductase family protein [Streptomyces sp. MI02-7b]MDX3071668.1 TlpA disulfide reductase family protein [Streptomyces sp. MI02-7b]